MLPMFVPPDDDPSRSQRTRYIMIMALGLLIAGVLMLTLMARANLYFILMMVVVVFISFLVLTRSFVNRTQASATDKRKRGLDGQDMYTLIDRLVEDLDEDEAAYLRRRLDEQERGLQRQQTEESLTELLDQREQNRLEE